MRKKRFWIVILCIVISVISVSCSKKQENNTTPQPEPADAEDAVIISLDIEPDEGFDPLLGWGRYGTLLFQSTLLKRGRNQELSGDLATAWELSSDRLTWKINIRKDALFSDGSPLTAEDVAFTFNRASEARGKTDITVLEKAVAINPFLVEIHLKSPQITFVNRLTTLGIVPSRLYGDTYGRNPVGSGPYQLVRWDEGRQMIMKENPYYYGKKPEIKNVIFLFMEEDAAFVSAKAGNIHVLRIPQMLAKQTVSGMHLVSVKSVDNRGICFPFIPEQKEKNPAGYTVGNDVTSDVSIRKAVNYAVERSKLVEGILEGFGSPAHGPVNMLPWDEPGAVILDGNPEMARDILEKGGWKDTDEDGVLEKGAIEAAFTLLYPADDSIRQALSLAVSDTARKLGINITVMGKSWDDIYKIMHANAVLFGFGSFDQMEMHNLYFGNRLGDPVYNAGYYQNNTVDDYFKKAVMCPSEEEAISYWRLAQWDGSTGFTTKGDAAWAWLVNLDHTYFISDRIDIGSPFIEQHGSFIIANLTEWRWQDCETEKHISLSEK